jgi:hypothetical protein
MCAPCPAGTYQGVNGYEGSKCTDCTAGKYAANTASQSCTNCPVDTYSADTGSIDCTDCAEGTSSAAGSSSCTPDGDDGSGGDDYYGDDTSPAPTVSAGSGCPGMLLHYV